MSLFGRYCNRVCLRVCVIFLFLYGQAYPGRIPFLEFFERFELLQRQLVQASTAGKETLALPHPAHATEAEAKEGCRSILESFLPAKFYQIGHTRVSC